MSRLLARRRGLSPAPFLYAAEAWRTLRQVREDRVAHRKCLRVPGKRFERLSVRAPATCGVWMVLERALRH